MVTFMFEMQQHVGISAKFKKTKAHFKKIET